MKKIFLYIILFIVSHKTAMTQSVGIGTTTPTEKLHVAGNIKADTLKPNAIKLLPNAGAGKILTSDALGVASWQSNYGGPGGNVGYGSWGDCATNANISEYIPVTDSAGISYADFGQSVAISGNYAIIGSPTHTVAGNESQGRVSIYFFNGTAWVQKQIITDASGAANDLFGLEVAISGNYAIVGASSDDVGGDVNQGSVSIYQFNGITWVLMQKIVEAAGSADDYFGNSVSISGNVAIVGIPNDDVGANSDQGAVNIYQYNGTSWVFAQKITDVFGAASELFGYSVSISGNHIIVGAPYDTNGANTWQGSASIYNYNGSSWVQFQKTTDATGASYDRFGNSVSISGNYALVGAPYDGNGSNTSEGSVSFFQNQTVAWGLMQKKAEGIGANENFGFSVELSGNYAILGAPFRDIEGNLNQGAAFIYQRVGQLWQRLQIVIDPAGDEPDKLGIDACLDGTSKRFLIGAPEAGSNGVGKAIFGKIN